MADDVSLVIGFSSAIKAAKALKNIGTEAKKTSSTLEKAFSKAESDFNKAVKNVNSEMRSRKALSNQRIKAFKEEASAEKKRTDGEITLAKKVLSFKSRMAKQRDAEESKAAKLAVTASQNEERLKNKYQAGYAAMGVYSRELNDLAVAREKDIITAEEQKRAVEALNLAQKNGTGVFSTYTKGFTQGKNKMNAFNVKLQQGGYQLQDFAVQMQSGTSFFTAFAQQGSQFAGVFGPMGAVAGAVIAVGSIVAGMAYKFFMAGKDVKTLDDALSDLKDNVSGLSSAFDNLTKGDYFDKFGLLTDNFRELNLLTVAISDNLAAMDASDAVAGIIGSFKEMGSNLMGFGKKGIDMNDIFTKGGNIFAARDTKSAEVISGDLGGAASSGQVRFFIEEMKRLEEAEAPAQDIVNAMNDFSESVEKGKDKLKGASLEGLILLGNIRATSEAMQEQISLLDGSAAAAKRAREQQELLLKNNAAGDAAILERQAALEIELFNANAKYESDQKALDAAGDIAILNRQADAEKELMEANSQYESDQNEIRSKELDELNKKVTELAERLAIPFAAALGLIRQAKREASVGLDAFGGGGDFKYEDATTFTPAGFGKKPKVGGGGKDPRKQLAEYLESKRQELELETKLVGIFGDERDIQTELFNIKSKYSKVITPEQKKELENILRLTLAEKERQVALEETAAQQQQLADLIGNSMEKSMMGIVDGTMSVKDAFKSMAADIIKELYRVLVVQKVVAAAKGFFGFADGGAFSGGSQVQAYANGGVVNGPTTFGMSGGKTGLMGEAGPEAIMPLKRGSNGKLGVQMEGGGGGDTIVVHQNFNFQSNGDDSIKKLIAQAAPQISAMTKSSLLNDRRRGGATKAAFG